MRSLGPRVLHVIPGLNGGGGAEQSFRSTAPLLVELGVQLHLAVWSGRRALVPQVRDAGVVFHDLAGADSTWSRAVRLRRLVRDERIDLVHASLHEAAVACQLVRATTSVPLLVTWATTSYGMLDADAEGIARHKQRLVRLEDTLLDRVSRCRYQAVTAGVARTNGRRLRVPASRITVVERGRDPADFVEPGPPEPPLPVPPGAQVVLAVGRQERVKGYPDLIRAFDAVAARRPRAHLVIAGREGSDTERIRAARAGSAVADRIHLLGQREDVAALLAASTIVAMSSTREGAAGAVLEAMGAGRPILGCRLDGLAGVLRDGDNAVVVDRAALAEGLARLLDDEQLRGRLGRRARADFLERFTSDRAARGLFELYGALVSEAAGHAKLRNHAAIRSTTGPSS